jgi:hypothetical protein
MPLTPEEELFSIVKSKLETNSVLMTLAGGTPRVHYWKQNPNTDYPYFVYDLNDIRGSEPAGLTFTGKLTLSCWFYASNALNAFKARSAIIEMFNEKYVYGSNLVNCRLWHTYDGRKETEKKDAIRDKEVICHEISFEARWFVQSHVEAASYPS